MGRAVKANRCAVRADEGVSDVVGAILLVGITLALAGGFAAVVFQIDGPEKVIHVSLSASIGPGSNGVWGPGEGELRLEHLGGQPLPDDDVRVLLEYPDGTVVEVLPVFDGGVLLIGQRWSGVVDAENGQTIEILVIHELNGFAQILFSSGSTAQAVAGAALSFPVSFTDTTGTMTSFVGMQSDNDGNFAAIISEEDTASGGSGETLSGSSVNSFGATDPNNVLLSDDQRATLLTTSTWAEAGGFSPTGTGSVTQVLIGFEAQGPVAASTVSHVETVSTQGNVGLTITSPVVQGVSGQFYLTAIENSDTVKRTVTGVTGLGLAWTKVNSICADENIGGCIDVWRGNGDAVTGTVTATFSADADKGAIAVSRFSGVDLNSPIQAHGAAEGPGTGGSSAWTAPTVTGTSNGLLYVALGSHDRQGSTWNNPTNVRASLGEKNEIWLSVADGPASDGSNVASGTLIGGADDWHVVALTLRPDLPPAPTATVSYSISGTTGLTTTQATLGQTDQTYTVDVTPDRAWTLTDVQNMLVRATAGNVAGGPVLVDHIFTTVSTAGAGAQFAADMELQWSGVPAGTSHTLEIRHKVGAPGDVFHVELWDGAAWRQCPGTMAANVYQVFSCDLLAAEYLSGAPKARITDNTPTGGNQGTLTIEYARISTT